MNKSLFYLESIMMEEERFLKRLVKLSMWEQSRLTWGQRKMIPPLIKNKQVLIKHVKALEAERQKIRFETESQLSKPRDLPEKLQSMKILKLEQRMKKLTDVLLRVNQENALLIKNSAMRHLQTDYSSQHADVCNVWNSVSQIYAGE